MAAVHHLGFLKIRNVNSLRGTMPNFDRLLQPLLIYGDFLSANLDLLCMCLNQSQKLFDYLYHCAKFGWNWCSSFDNMQVWIFCELRLKTCIRAPKMRVGIWPQKWWILAKRTQWRHFLVRKHAVQRIVRQNRSTGAGSITRSSSIEVWDRATQYVTQNLVRCCTTVEIMSFDEACNRWLTLKVDRGHRNYRDLMSQIWLPINGLW